MKITYVKILEKKVLKNLDISKISGLICFSDLPNFLFTKYKKVFNRKKWTYQDRRIEFFINFAPENPNVDKLINHGFCLCRCFWPRLQGL